LVKNGRGDSKPSCPRDHLLYVQLVSVLMSEFKWVQTNRSAYLVDFRRRASAIVTLAKQNNAPVFSDESLVQYFTEIEDTVKISNRELINDGTGTITVLRFSITAMIKSQELNLDSRVSIMSTIIKSHKVLKQPKN
jgi:hypothetical protein